jgi:hypothetical protein
MVTDQWGRTLRRCPACRCRVVVTGGNTLVEHCPPATARTPMWAMLLRCPGSGEHGEELS